jgi:hypothetical protein
MVATEEVMIQQWRVQYLRGFMVILSSLFLIKFGAEGYH